VTAPLQIGTATAAYQVEGAGGGRGRSIWDVFAERPGAVADGSDGSVACDSYHRLDEDLALLERLGVDLYRFSVSWPRVQPDGRGRPVAAGLDHYDRVVDGLLARGITPFPTLYHWDLPQPLQEAGGWPSADLPPRFVEYALAVHERLGDRVPRWATMNEPWCSAFLGHGSGVHAPGVRDPQAAFAAAHHLLLAHGLAAGALRSAGAEVGIVLNLYPVHAEGPEFADAARVVDEVQNTMWLDALLDGRYPNAVPADLHRAEDLDRIRGSLDWLGVNYYTPLRIGAPEPDGSSADDQAAYPGAGEFGLHPRGPLTTMRWEVEADGLRQVLTRVADRAPGLPLHVTENGVALPDADRTPDGAVDDPQRIAYLRDHLAAVDAAREQGADVRSYIVWTLLDNFEWGWGYTQTFGVVEVDRATQDRRPKASFSWLAAEIARRRG
jgi:beta-glucosidase